MQVFRNVARMALGCSVFMAGASIAGTTDPVISTTPSVATSAPVPDQAKAQRVCRSIMLTGTRMSKRYCRTQAEWDRDAELARRQLFEGQRDNSRRDGEMNRGGL